MKAGLITKLNHRLDHFTKMRDIETENGKDERDDDWKRRVQYLQGRVEGLSEAIEIINKHCGGCLPHSHGVNESKGN